MAAVPSGGLVKVADRVVVAPGAVFLGTTFLRRGSGAAAAQVMAWPSGSGIEIAFHLEVSSDRVVWIRVADFDTALNKIWTFETAGPVPPSRYIRFGAEMTSGSAPAHWLVSAWMVPG